MRAGARADARRDCAFRGGFGAILRFWEDGVGASKIFSCALFLNRSFHGGFGAIFGAFLRLIVVSHEIR